MAMPDTGPAPEGTWATILLKLGAMGEDIAVIKSGLANLPGLAERLRQVELSLERNQGGRDLLSRVLAIAGVVIAVAAAAAAWKAVAGR